MIEINCSYWITNCNLLDFSDSFAVDAAVLSGGTADGKWIAAQFQSQSDIDSLDESRQIIPDKASREYILSFLAAADVEIHRRDSPSQATNVELAASILQHISGSYLAEQGDIEAGLIDSIDYDGWFYRKDGDIYFCIDF